MALKYSVDSLDSLNKILGNYLHKQERINKNLEIKVLYILLFLMRLMLFASKEV